MPDTKQDTKAADRNRRNASRSTGPRTARGKAIVSKNALRHGLLSKDNVLPFESAEDFEALTGRLTEQLQPEGELEGALVERVAGCLWRLRRLGKVEAGIFTYRYFSILRDRAGREAQRLGPPTLDTMLADFDGGGPAPADRKRHAEALQAQEQAQAASLESTPTLGQAFVLDVNEAGSFAKLSRYETAIERSLYSALHELQRLQAARQGVDTPLPVAADVSVSVGQ